MNRQGRVIAEKGPLCVVQLVRHEACNHCHACELGQEEAANSVKVEVYNGLGAQKGALVEIDMADTDVLRAAFYAYTIPLLVLVATLVASTFLLKTTSLAGVAEAGSAIISIAATFFTYVILKKKDEKFRKSGKYTASVVSIVSELPFMEPEENRGEFHVL